jgi:hypothetical protein
VPMATSSARTATSSVAAPPTLLPCRITRYPAAELRVKLIDSRDCPA